MVRLGGDDDALAAEMHAKFPEFSESLILSFLDAFTFYDQRQTKSIGFASLGPALMILGLNPRRTELRAAIREVILVPFDFGNTFARYNIVVDNVLFGRRKARAVHVSISFISSPLFTGKWRTTTCTHIHYLTR